MHHTWLLVNDVVVTVYCVHLTSLIPLNVRSGYLSTVSLREGTQVKHTAGKQRFPADQTAPGVLISKLPKSAKDWPLKC